jgi:hypothetical protein
MSNIPDNEPLDNDVTDATELLLDRRYKVEPDTNFYLKAFDPVPGATDLDQALQDDNDEEDK